MHLTNFTIIESDKFFVNKINIFGNNITEVKVIRNQLEVDEGDPFNKLLHAKSINNLKSLRIFEKVIFLLFIEIRLKKFVIFDFWSFTRVISFVGAKFKRVGRRVKVIIKDVIKPNVIIQPKSMIGLIPLKIKDRKANIVVKTVYKIGQNIFSVVKDIISKLLLAGLLFLN